MFFFDLYIPSAFHFSANFHSPRKLSRRVDVQAHVVDDHRLAQLGHHLVHKRLAQTLGQVLDVRAQHDRGQKLARVLGLGGRLREPALGGGEPGRSQPRLRVGGVGIDLGGPGITEALRVGLALHDHGGATAQLGDVLLSPHWATSRPPGRRTPYRRRNSAS